MRICFLFFLFLVLKTASCGISQLIGFEVKNCSVQDSTVEAICNSRVNHNEISFTLDSSQSGRTEGVNLNDMVICKFRRSGVLTSRSRFSSMSKWVEVVVYSPGDGKINEFQIKKEGVFSNNRLIKRF